ncbi:hypothetical protein BVRB_9g224580 [Beta vulgaris subsp. vulgaris]|uniref:Uncharacterized protein n=1 Tax=Beta vulgaris subsp. vulgaris TaxID=3555 RepID=A0A0J8E037_BETVV|nr:hypothetical protein BVRB_9g224580 [Beta vulgaris subsp. vulgaris]
MFGNNYLKYFSGLEKRATPINGVDTIVKANNVGGDVYEDQAEFKSIAE